MNVGSARGCPSQKPAPFSPGVVWPGRMGVLCISIERLVCQSEQSERSSCTVSAVCEVQDVTMKIRIWGTRGSYPVANEHVLRYGGNTTCIEVRIGDTCIILDAGTGLRRLGQALVAEESEQTRHLHMLVTHTHWDHIIGFPFFDPIYRPNMNLSIYGLKRTEASLHTIFDNAVSDPLLPIGLESLSARLDFHELDHDQCFALNQDVHILTARSNHPYRALGYRIESPNGILTFIPDTGPFHTVLFGDERVVWTGQPTARTAADLRELEVMRTGIVHLAEGADWMIYDSQFTMEEYKRFPHWGHSTPEQAMEIAHEAGVRNLILFHHDPHRKDTALAEIEAQQQAAAPHNLRVCAAYEGMELARGHER